MELLANIRKQRSLSLFVRVQGGRIGSHVVRLQEALCFQTSPHINLPSTTTIIVFVGYLSFLSGFVMRTYKNDGLVVDGMEAQAYLTSEERLVPKHELRAPPG